MSGDLQAVVDAAVGASVPQPLDPGLRYAITVPRADGPTIVDPLPDAALPEPRRLKGTTRVDDVGSLAELWHKYADDSSEVYATESARTITAVFDADCGPFAPRHRAHRAQLVLDHSPQWTAWASISGKWLTQIDFAEFLEDRAVDLERPTAAEALELAQHFEATTRVDFKSAERTSSSARTLVYDETVAAKAGQAGNIEIPTEFVILVRPFVASPVYRVTARFRYRILNGSLSLGIVLVRASDVLEDAFSDVVGLVGQELLGASEGDAEAVAGRRVLRGTPPSPVG